MLDAACVSALPALLPRRVHPWRYPPASHCWLTCPHLPPTLPCPSACLQIRRLPKPVVAAVAGYAVGGGHILHMMCDLTIAADNAVFGQTGPKVGSFDAGYGSTQVGWGGLGGYWAVRVGQGSGAQGRAGRAGQGNRVQDRADRVLWGSVLH